MVRAATPQLRHEIVGFKIHLNITEEEYNLFNPNGLGWSDPVWTDFEDHLFRAGAEDIDMTYATYVEFVVEHAVDASGVIEAAEQWFNEERRNRE